MAIDPFRGGGLGSRHMERYWATRTGRWRQALREHATAPLHERVYQVVRHDIEAGLLPAGAIMPAAQRVADELMIDVADVDTAYGGLAADGWLRRDKSGVLRIASRDEEASVGDQTQVRFEAALINAMREAAARGLSAHEATGMFRAAMQRMTLVEQSRKKVPGKG
jgi:DNA-binding transcriptional MocR family regulator